MSANKENKEIFSVDNGPTTDELKTAWCYALEGNCSAIFKVPNLDEHVSSEMLVQLTGVSYDDDSGESFNLGGRITGFTDEKYVGKAIRGFYSSRVKRGFIEILE